MILLLSRDIESETALLVVALSVTLTPSTMSFIWLVDEVSDSPLSVKAASVAARDCDKCDSLALNASWLKPALSLLTLSPSFVAVIETAFAAPLSSALIINRYDEPSLRIDAVTPVFAALIASRTSATVELAAIVTSVAVPLPTAIDKVPEPMTSVVAEYVPETSECAAAKVVTLSA